MNSSDPNASAYQISTQMGYAWLSQWRFNRFYWVIFQEAPISQIWVRTVPDMGVV